MKKDIARVFGSNLIKMLVTLLTTFIIPMVLSVENYGYYKLYVFYASYVGISHLGFCDGIYLKYGGVDIDKVNKREVSSEWSSLLAYEAFVAIAIAVVGIIKHDFIIICLGATAIPTVLFTFYTYVYQATGDFAHYTRIMNLSTAINLVMNLVLVLLRVDDYRAFVICNVSIQTVSFIIGSISFHKRNWLIFTGFSIEIIKSLISAGFLLMVGNFAYTLFIGIDKWFIKFTMEITDFSMYSFAGQLLTVVNMFITPISMTLYSNISKRKEKSFEIKIKKILVTFLMVFPVTIYALTYIIRHFMKQYIPAISVASILLITQLFLSLNLSVFINMYKAYKRQKDYFVRLVIALVIACLLDSIVFITGPNTIGYALATLISCFVWLGLNMKYFPHLIPNWRETVYVVAVMGTYLLTLFVGNEIVRCVIFVPIYILLTRTLMIDEWKYAIATGKKAVAKISSRH